MVLQRASLWDDGGDHVCLVGTPIDVIADAATTPLRLSGAPPIEPGHEADERATPSDVDAAAEPPERSTPRRRQHLENAAAGAGHPVDVDDLQRIGRSDANRADRTGRSTPRRRRRSDGPRPAPAGLVGLPDGHCGVRRRGPAAVHRAAGHPPLPAAGDPRRARARRRRPDASSRCSPTTRCPGYQTYDKALDVYYLAIAYISTMRNWRDPVAFRSARFLYLYRLVGVTLFELLDAAVAAARVPEHVRVLLHRLRVRAHPLEPGRGSARRRSSDWRRSSGSSSSCRRSGGSTSPSSTSPSSWPTTRTCGSCSASPSSPRRSCCTSSGRRIPRPDWPFTVDVDRHLAIAGRADGRHEPFWSPVLAREGRAAGADLGDLRPGAPGHPRQQRSASPSASRCSWSPTPRSARLCAGAAGRGRRRSGSSWRCW